MSGLKFWEPLGSVSSHQIISRAAAEPEVAPSLNLNLDSTWPQVGYRNLLLDFEVPDVLPHQPYKVSNLGASNMHRTICIVLASLLRRPTQLISLCGSAFCGTVPVYPKTNWTGSLGLNARGVRRSRLGWSYQLPLVPLSSRSIHIHHGAMVSAHFSPTCPQERKGATYRGGLYPPSGLCASPA